MPADPAIQVESRATILILADDFWLELRCGYRSNKSAFAFTKTDSTSISFASQDPTMHHTDLWMTRYPPF